MNSSENFSLFARCFGRSAPIYMVGRRFLKAFDHYDQFYREIAQAPCYGSTLISRPYIDFKDKVE